MYKQFFIIHGKIIEKIALNIYWILKLICIELATISCKAKTATTKTNPFFINSFKVLVAQILKSVASLEFTLYPTSIIASRL